MTQGDDQHPRETDGGGQPAAKNHELVAAINALAAQYETAHQGNSEHGEKTLIWTRCAGVGVAIYTLLTLGLVVVAICQLRTAQDTEQRQLRAYVGLANEEPKVESVRVTVPVVNYGETPAKFVQIFVNLEFTKPNVFRLPDDFTFPDKPYCPNERLYGGQTIFPKNTLKSQRLHCPDEIPKLFPAGNWNAFLYGRIEYRDVFDQKWKTTYCILFSNGVGAWCDRHNEVDAKE